MEEELGYHPVLGDADRVVSARAPMQVLVVDGTIPSAAIEHGEVRVASSGGVQLPMGLYSFATDDGWLVMVVGAGAPQGQPVSATWDAPDEDPLVNAYGWFAEWWPEAEVVPPPTFDRGDEALTVPAGQEAIIRSRDFHAGTWWYQARVEGRTVNLRELALAHPHVDDDPFEWIARPPADAHRFAATLTRSKLNEQLTDTVYSFRATRTIFRPYQFRPVIRLLDTGKLRLLIADEVGLGKTIEAGLIWTELDARNLANRVLVVCPSGLVPKWRAEMEERFSYDLVELTKDGLDEMLERVETDRLPKRYHVICSVERLRVWSGLERLAELAPQFDLVIVDEAHVFRNSGTRSHALGGLLSDWADALVFLSATPLNLGNDDLYNLLELLAPGEFDDRYVLEQRLEPNAVLNRIGASFFDRDVDNRTRRDWLQEVGSMVFGSALTSRLEYRDLDDLLTLPALAAGDIARAKRLIAQLHALSAVVTRTRKVEVEDHKAVREARTIDVAWTDPEAEFYRLFDTWQRDRARRKGLPVGFVTQMPLRLASTCLPAARDRVLNRDVGEWVDVEADEAEYEDGDTGSVDVDVDVDLDLDLDVPPREVVDAARRLGDVDTKFDRFLEYLEPIVDQGKQVLVFTFSRKALAYLRERLAPNVRVAVLHGDVSRDDRHRIMQDFRHGRYDVIVASRVASEGLDFEFCSAVVNYDLPWNPMEVEQRIGRIDRFGQAEDKVLIFNFHTPGTIESEIIERVHQRIGVFSDSIGELEPILRSRLAELRQITFNFSLTPEQRDRRLDEVMAAVEEQQMTREDVETASAFLSSTDRAEIDGFEQELTSTGRYVGQRELMLLIQDWCADSAGAQTKASADGRLLTVRGNAAMAEHLRGVQAAGERSASEIDQLYLRIRDEVPIEVSLDQEFARVGGPPLLTANHPLVRAALRVPGYAQERFATVGLHADEIPDGEFLVLLALAKWSGLRPTTEIWTATANLDTGTEGPNAVGDALLAALAEGEVEPSAGAPTVDLGPALGQAVRLLRHRQLTEEAKRVAANEALVETRRISLRETHSRKVGQIRRRIATLQQEGKTGVIHLQQAQLDNQARLLREAEDRIDASRQGAMLVEDLAVCTVEVRR